MSTELIFSAEDATGDTDLWSTNGTVAGTQSIGGVGNKSLFDVYLFGLAPEQITSIGGVALFIGESSSSFSLSGAYSLWRSDGTVAGTYEIGGTDNAGIVGAEHPNDRNPTDLNASNFVAFGHEALFYGTDADNYRGLWVSNGTTAGTTEIGGLKNGGIKDKYFSGLDPTNFTALGNRLFFSGYDTDDNYGLWVTDVTASGTIEIGGLDNAGVKDFGGDIEGGVALGNTIIFDAVDAAGKNSVWA